MYIEVYSAEDIKEHVFRDNQTINKILATFSAVINEDIRCGWCL